MRRPLPQQQAEPPRVTVADDEPGRLEIVVLGRRNRDLATYLVWFTVIWVMGGGLPAAMGLAGVPMRARSTPWSLETFVAIWGLLVVLGGVLPFWAYLRGAAARETVTLDGQTLRVRWELLGLRRTRVFDLRRVRDLQPTDAPDNPWAGSERWRAWARPSGGALAFDYDGRTHTFGDRLDADETGYVLAQIGRRFPALLGRG
jgi:hypothetical protein